METIYCKTITSETDTSKKLTLRLRYPKKALSVERDDATVFIFARMPKPSTPNLHKFLPHTHALKKPPKYSVFGTTASMSHIAELYNPDIHSTSTETDTPAEIHTRLESICYTIAEQHQSLLEPTITIADDARHLMKLSDQPEITISQLYRITEPEEDDDGRWIFSDGSQWRPTR